MSTVLSRTRVGMAIGSARHAHENARCGQNVLSVNSRHVDGRVQRRWWIFQSAVHQHISSHRTPLQAVRLGSIRPHGRAEETADAGAIYAGRACSRPPRPSPVGRPTARARSSRSIVVSSTRNEQPFPSPRHQCVKKFQSDTQCSTQDVNRAHTTKTRCLSCY